ncbi:MAG: copper chaperone PCu(A)C, partial [Silicimonas sp.]|nr:copper chaperone PCu(A)C [Silicimonas sp.]
TADRLIGAASPVAQMVELHTHIEADGIMRMRPIEGGIEVQAGQTHMLQRGGDHVMLMGVTETLENGDVVPLVLTFEQAGEVELEVVVDNDREQGHGN